MNHYHYYYCCYLVITWRTIAHQVALVVSIFVKLLLQFAWEQRAASGKSNSSGSSSFLSAALPESRSFQITDYFCRDRQPDATYQVAGSHHS